MRSLMRRSATGRAGACAGRPTRRRRQGAPPRGGRRTACSTSAAASSQALSVPCPKCTRARASLPAARAINARSVTARPVRRARPRTARVAVWNNSLVTIARARLLLAAAALCAALGGYWLAQQLDRASPRLASGTWLPRPKPVGDFRLTDTTGRPFTRAELGGAPTLMFFGFTRCPDVCPTTLPKLPPVEVPALAADLRRAAPYL